MADMENDLNRRTFDVGADKGMPAGAMGNGGATYTTPQTVSGAGEVYAYENDLFTATEDSALLVESATVTVTASSFSVNCGTWGGAINNDAGTVSVSGSTFCENTSTKDGGAVFNSGTAAMSVTNCAFDGNEGSYGGAIVNDEESFISIAGSSFSDNRGWNYGGAAYNSGTMTIDSCGFSGNATGDNDDAAGGAVFNDGLLEVIGSTFSSGSASWYGGAIYNEAGSAGISGGRFLENCADSVGGAVYNASGTVSILGADFAGNSAGYLGGAVCNEEVLSVSGGTFAGNFAEDGGGAIYNYGEMSVDGAVFAGNSAGVSGGAIYNAGSMTITDSVLATETDTICNEGDMTLAGTVGLAADVRSVDEGICFCSSGLVLDFINTTSISVAELTDAENILGLSFRGGGAVNFSLLSLAETSISIDCALPGDGKTLTVAMGLSSLGTGAITVHGETVTDGSVVVDGKTYVVRLSGSDLVIASAVKAGIVTPGGTEMVVIDGVIYTGDAFGSLDNALEAYSTAAVKGCTLGTQSAIGSGKTAVIDMTGFHGSSVSGNGGAISNDGMASVFDSTFSGNAASEGGAVYNAGSAALRDSVFVTSTDTVRNTGAMTIGGTIRTAANIASDTEITVEPETELVLDLSVYDGTTTRELLTGFDTMFGTSQENLAISIDVSQDQGQGTYVLATGVSSLAQQDFAVTINGGASPTLVVTIGKKALHGNKLYALDLADETLSLDVVSFQWDDDNPVITVPADGTTDHSGLCITGLKLLDVKAAGTYKGAILETQPGKANVKIANGGKVEIIELRQHEDGSLTTVAMKKNASLVVLGPNGMSGIAKLTTGDGSTVEVGEKQKDESVVGGDIVCTTANDTITIGKANSVTIGGKLDLKEGKNTLKIGANSTVGIAGGVSKVQTLTLTAGAKDKVKGQLRTFFTADDITGAMAKSKVTIGNFSSFTADSIVLDGEGALTAGGPGSKLEVKGKVSGINTFRTGNGKDTSENGAVLVDIDELDLTGAKKNTLTIGKFGTATIGSVDINAKATVSIGANGTVTIDGTNLKNISKLTVAAGSKYKDVQKNPHQGYTSFKANGVTGTSANDTLTFGNFGTATMGDIDLNGGKNTLNIGGQDVEFKAGDVKNISSLKVAAGKSAELYAKVTADNIEFNQVSNKLDIGAYADFDADDVMATLDDPKTKMAVNVGSAATVNLRSMDHVSSLKVAAGKKNKTSGDIDKTYFDANGIKGTDYNDTFAFGNDVTAEFGTIDMGGNDDKDKLTIGKGSSVGTGIIRNVEQISLGDNSALTVVSSCELEDCKITGSAGDNTLFFGQYTHVGEVDLGKGNDSIGFLLVGSLIEVDTRCVIDRYSGGDSLFINTTEYEGSPVPISDDKEALLEQKDGGLWLTVRMK